MQHAVSPIKKNLNITIGYKYFIGSPFLLFLVRATRSCKTFVFLFFLFFFFCHGELSIFYSKVDSDKIRALCFKSHEFFPITIFDSCIVNNSHSKVDNFCFGEEFSAFYSADKSRIFHVFVGKILIIPNLHLNIIPNINYIKYHYTKYQLYQICTSKTEFSVSPWEKYQLYQICISTFTVSCRVLKLFEFHIYFDTRESMKNCDAVYLKIKFRFLRNFPHLFSRALQI